MTRNQRKSITLVVLQIAALAAAVSIQLNIAFASPQEQPNQHRSRCNYATEFHCKLEDRCIARELHCDFQEQCLDGEDELGCPPERCNFQHDHCYWLDASLGNHTHTLWRRFSTASSGPGRSPQSLSTSKRATATRLRSAELAPFQSLGALLAELSSSPPERTKFLFVPLTWTRPATGNHLWTRRAEIKTPPIGRSSGACQLRFEFAMLSTPLPDGVSNASITLKLVAIPNRPQPGPIGENNSIEFQRQIVWSHQLARQAPESSHDKPSGLENASRGDQQRWTVGVAELGHLRNFELSFEAKSSIWPESIGGSYGGDSEHSGAKFNHVERDGGSRTGPGGGANSSWPTGPAGSIGQGRLSGGRNQPIDYESDLPGGGHEDDAGLRVKSGKEADPLATKTTRSSAAAVASFEGALVALRWLEFNNCHDWPQVRGEQVKPGINDDEFNTDEDLTNPDLDETIAIIPDENCSRNEFSCSAGSCLHNKLLCNFQDECYSFNGRPSFAWPWPAKSKPMSDDESDDLCRNVLGRENFEPPTIASSTDLIREGGRDSRQMQLFSTSKPEKFWHLTGTWPIGSVSIRSSQSSKDTKRQVHLPSHDHTTRSAEGSFLSLEVPPLSSTRDVSIAYWAGITSQWMQKLDEDRFGLCRLKFFFNIISPLLNRPGDVFSSRSDTLKLIIALEHVTLSKNAQKLQHQQQWPFGRQQPKLEKYIDMLLHSGLDFDTSQLVTYNRSHSPIELAGLDFWREANFEVADLKAGDLFQLRLVILVQLQSSASSRGLNRNEPIGSINIDDMATHFGCAPVEDGHQLVHLNNMALSFWQSAVPTLSDYVKPHHPNRTELRRQLPHLKNKWDRFKTIASPQPEEANYDEDEFSARNLSSQLPHNDNGHNIRRRFEQVPAQLLVAYVLCAFCLIIGVIALIVFVMVPHVERAMMQHQNQIQLSLSGEISDVPATVSHSTASDFLPISTSGSSRTGTLFGSTFDYLDDETPFSGSRNDNMTSDQAR